MTTLEVPMTTPSDIRVLTDPDTVRLIADPLRLRLLELLRERPRTVSELADALDLPRTRLYYHMKLLEEHELVTVDATREVSGITERTYRVTAWRFSVDKALLGPEGGSGSPLETYLTVILDEVATEIRRAVAAGLIDVEATREDTFAPRNLVLGRKWYRFTPEQLAVFGEHYAAFESEHGDQAVFRHEGCGKAAPEPEEGDLYEWLIAFYPIVPPAGDDDA
jgi:DNA-binding transcriptional ArsR family regulator